MKLHRLPALALFVSLSVLSLPAQPVVTAASTNKTTKHCLWEVKGKSKTVFLLGSLHLMKKNMYPLDAPIENAYKNADIVVFETDMAAMESPEFALKLMKEATYPEGETLKKNLPEATYSMLVSNLQATVGSAEPFEKFKPWMVAVTLIALELQKLGFSAEKGIDKHFYARAREDQKSIQELEAPEEQLKLLTSLNDIEAGDFLGQSLSEMAVWRTQFSAMVEAWRVGDTKGLEKILTESFERYPALEKKFLTSRNEKWLGKIEKLLQGDKNVLIVVGAAHLAGTDSVVDLLTRKGFKVEQR
ncbi:MAG TPA: TraB/GumN family protein [Verrucomicrobiae bacterium]|nr:TraB/GumN family protein [Verrucomicrobiae bacterium]